METLPVELKHLIMSYAHPIHPCKQELLDEVGLKRVRHWTKRCLYWTKHHHPHPRYFRWKAKMRADEWRVD